MVRQNRRCVEGKMVLVAKHPPGVYRYHLCSELKPADVPLHL